MMSVVFEMSVGSSSSQSFGRTPESGVSESIRAATSSSKRGTIPDAVSAAGANERRRVS
jgi:hypothetical protein